MEFADLAHCAGVTSSLAITAGFDASVMFIERKHCIHGAIYACAGAPAAGADITLPKPTLRRPTDRGAVRRRRHSDHAA